MNGTHSAKPRQSAARDVDPPTNAEPATTQTAEPERDVDRHLDQRPDAVEAALADALTKAATAGRFDVVAKLATELEARRLARTSSNVVDLAGRPSRER